MKICHYLESQHILSPSAYFGRIRSDGVANERPYYWYVQTVTQLLSKQEYCGDTVNFRTEKVSHKSKKINYHNPKDYTTFKDTYEAIIDKDVFERVQIRLPKGKEFRLLRKSLYLAAMQYVLTAENECTS